MKNKYLLILTGLLLITLSSCTDSKINNENYNFSIKRFYSFGKVESINNFKRKDNIIEDSNIEEIDIKAEQINLSRLLAFLVNIDESEIQFEDKSLNQKLYEIIIEQKNDMIDIKDLIIDDLENILDIKIQKQYFNSYELYVFDSTKFFSHKSKSLMSKSTINNYNSKPLKKIKLEKASLCQLSSVLNSVYNEGFKADKGNLKFDYFWEANSLEETIDILRNNLGIKFNKIGDKKLIILVSKR